MINHHEDHKMNVLRLLCDAEYYHDMEWKKSHVFFYHHKPATFTGDCESEDEASHTHSDQ